MSVTIVIEQMIMIVLLIAMGFYSYRKSILTDESARGISALIVNFTNPCLMVHSMLNSGDRISGRMLAIGFLSVIVADALLILIAEILPRLLKIEQSERYCYWMLCVFGNIGFIGIPLTSAVLGEKALVYVSIHNLVFSLLIYTVGISKIKTAAGETGEGGAFSLKQMKSFVNAGTVSVTVALILYIMGASLPRIVMSTIDYAGRATTFLSMMILGTAVARMSVKQVVKDVRLILFSIIRLTAVPALLLILMKPFIKDDLLVYTTALMLAVPAGNMPLIIATQHGLKAQKISDGIVLTTILSVFTIPLVALFV
ncbi:MAG: AEC family transporter [Lachnospiraceae bacterium]|nr:AEC family transporter [Lachnospiraceae bacterium]